MNKILATLIGKEKNSLTFLVVLCLLSQMVAYYKFGFFVSEDSAMYITDAQSIIDGVWPMKRNFWYSSYSFVIAVIIFFGGKATDIVIVQALTSVLASIGIYKLTQRITRNNTSAFVATILYILWFKIHQWNMIVYTDALFTSATVITIVMIHFSTKKIHYLFSFFASIFTILLRPTGIGFLVAILAYLIFNLFKTGRISKFYKFQFIIFSSVLIILLLNFVLRNYISSFLESYAKAEIIYPNISLNVARSEDLIIPEAHFPPLIRLVIFIFSNPIYFTKISLIKAALLLAHVKPYYSLFHNAVICIFLYPIYYFMLKGMNSFAGSNIKLFMLIFILFQVITVSLTSENWDGRFLLPILPYVFIIASFGITDLIESKLKLLKIH